jgi:hypothetical protein
MSDEPNGSAEETAGGIGGQPYPDGAGTASALLAGRNGTMNARLVTSAATKLRQRRNATTQTPHPPSKIDSWPVAETAIRIMLDYRIGYIDNSLTGTLPDRACLWAFFWRHICFWSVNFSCSLLPSALSRVQSRKI